MITVIVCLACIVAMCVVIAKACDSFEVGADYLGRNMKDGVKGMTLLAISSSIPEFMTTVFFLCFANPDKLGYNLAASFGGDAGSALFNSIIIPIVVVLTMMRVFNMKDIIIPKKVIARDGIAVILGEILLIVIFDSNTIYWWGGGLLVLFYLLYIGVSLGMMDRSGDKVSYEAPDEPNLYEKYLINGNKSIRAWVLILTSTAFIAAGCAILVHCTELIAVELQINMLFVSLIVVAAATSVPDIIMSKKEAAKGNSDAFTNVYGSNVFDLTISAGLPIMVYLLWHNTSIDFSGVRESLVDLRVVLLAITVATISTFYFCKRIGKLQLAFLFSLYLLFLLYCVGGAYPESTIGSYVVNVQELINKFL